MKTAIIYYSMGGNTAYAAEKLAEDISADLIRVRPVKSYPDKGFRKFLWGGKSALMAETPELEPYTFHAEEYDRIIIGFPVWAGSMAPPVRTFVTENRDKLQGKRIDAFACQSGSGAEKAIAKLRDCLGGQELTAVMILTDPKTRPKEENLRKIEAFRGEPA